MESKGTNVVTAITCGIGLLLLLAAAFDILPVADNTLIFLALACFIISAVIKRIGKGCCCK